MLKLSPQPHVPLMLGLLNTNSLESFVSTKSISVPSKDSWAFFSMKILTPVGGRKRKHTFRAWIELEPCCRKFSNRVRQRKREASQHVRFQDSAQKAARLNSKNQHFGRNQHRNDIKLPILATCLDKILSLFSSLGKSICQMNKCNTNIMKERQRIKNKFPQILFPHTVFFCTCTSPHHSPSCNTSSSDLSFSLV